VAQARFVSREEALKNLRSDPALAEVVAALGHNPLPDGYVVTARSRDAAGLEALAADLRNMAGVAHVQSDAQWARRLSALVGIGRLALWLLAAVLGIGLIAVTFNTIRLQILTRREEIEVSKLLGATDAFIRRPFYYLGLVQGLAGGMVALAIVAAGLAALNREVGALADSYGSSFRFAFPPAGDAAAIVLFAALIGWLGAYLSVGRELRQLD
jgi:cell division transport system permease protein